MPNFGDWSYWLLLIGVIVASVVLVYLAWWALFSDRSAGRRRCPRCWYDMAWSPGMTCAECGFTGVDERAFQKTHRRPGIALLAVLACVGLAVGVNERVTQRGYASMLPTRLLFWMLPLASDPSDTVFAELLSRSQSGRMNANQSRELIERSAAGDWWARPADDKWVLKYGSFISSWRATFVNDASLEAPLLGLPARIEASSRAVWPADAPVVVNVRVLDWWPVGMECRIRATPRLAGATTSTFYRTADTYGALPTHPLYLPPLDQAAREVTIDFQIDRRRIAGVRGMRISKPDDAWQPVASQSITVPVRSEGVMSDFAKPVDEPGMATPIAQVFGEGIRTYQQGDSPVRFTINTSTSYGCALNDTAVGVNVELMRDDVVARRLHVWWIAGAVGSSPDDRNYGFEVDYENAELLKLVNTADGRWSMRVRSDPLLALRAGKTQKYWSGQVIVPLEISSAAADEAPPRVWRTEE